MAASAPARSFLSRRRSSSVDLARDVAARSASARRLDRAGQLPCSASHLRTLDELSLGLEHGVLDAHVVVRELELLLTPSTSAMAAIDCALVLDQVQRLGQRRARRRMKRLVRLPDSPPSRPRPPWRPRQPRRAPPAPVARHVSMATLCCSQTAPWRLLGKISASLLRPRGDSSRLASSPQPPRLIASYPPRTP